LIIILPYVRGYESSKYSEYWQLRRSIDMRSLVLIILILIPLIGMGGDSYTSLGAYALGSTVTQVNSVGYSLQLEKPQNYFNTIVYGTKIDGTVTSLIFSDGLLHSITMKFEDSSFQEYLQNQQ
jgi:hypothetical protein